MLLKDFWEKKKGEKMSDLEEKVNNLTSDVAVLVRSFFELGEQFKELDIKIRTVSELTADFVKFEKDIDRETEGAIKELKEAFENLNELSSQNADSICWIQDKLKKLMKTLLKNDENK